MSTTETVQQPAEGKEPTMSKTNESESERDSLHEFCFESVSSPLCWCGRARSAGVHRSGGERELMPCFCGVIPLVVAEIETMPPKPLSVMCKTPDCVLFNKLLDAFKWNARSQQPQTAETVQQSIWDEAIREASDVLLGVMDNPTTVKERIVAALEAAKAASPAPQTVDLKQVAEKAAEKIADDFYFTDADTLANHKGDKKPIIAEIAALITEALTGVDLYRAGVEAAIQVAKKIESNSPLRDIISSKIHAALLPVGDENQNPDQG